MNFGDILRRLRTEKGIEQKQLAMEVQVSESAISNYENEIHDPDLDTLRKLSEYFHAIEPLEHHI
ncbi:MAG: helix-turn-helix domain-containing protein [bacterium]|nr:helix-turn-helix domain-containing protein [bacterium]